MLSKYEGLFDTTQLHIVQDSIERVQGTSSAKPKEVEVNGKTLIISDPVRRPKEEISEIDKKALRETYTSYKYELSDTDSEDGRYNLAEKFEAEVGVSGRFNRPTIVKEPDSSELIQND